MRYWLLIGFFLTVDALIAGDPKIIGQKPLSTLQGQPITILLTDVIIENPEKFDYPNGFILKIYQGSHYTFSGNTIYPNQNFIGTLKVPVRVEKNDDESKKFELKIEVKPPDNIPPVITGQVPITILQNTPVTIEFSHIIVTDLDDTYPNGFKIILSSGSNYTVNDRTITPHTNFTGILSVPVTVNDGKSNSQPFDLKIEVKAGGSPTSDVPANIPPVISGQLPITILPNTSITIQLSHLIVNDPDNKYPDDFSLLLSPGNFYTVNGHAVTPSENFVGVLTVRVTVSDGTSMSEPFDLKIRVSDQNELDIPSVFTPNNDNANDTWKISVLKDPRAFNKTVVRVYSKKGFVVFESVGIQHEWDGTLNGKPLPADVYFYVIEVPESGSPGHYKGTVIILR